jgi:hypothetical protein
MQSILAYQWNVLSRVLGELVGKFLVVRDQMGNIDVAVVLLDQYILADLISAFTSATKKLTMRSLRTDI